MEEVENSLFDTNLLEKWESQYHQLAAMQANQDNALSVRQDSLKKDLAQWAGMQRRVEHMLPARLKNNLAALDADPAELEPGWDQYLQQLTYFFQTHGHTFLPAGDPAYEPLQDWLIRQIRGQQYLSTAQYGQLDALGVDWDLRSGRDLRWQQMFLKLKEYHKTYGHSRVPQQWPQNRRLANWVAVQRRVYAQGKMPAGRLRLLEQLGFVWHIQSQYDLQWTGFYRQLAAFRLEQGHCRVPGRYPQLVSWIERQRIARKNKLLSAEREQQLNQIGFIWDFQDLKESQWQEKFRQLKQFKEKHGHCLVPLNYKENKSLGHWVSTQRRLEARRKLAKNKQRQLEQLGFVWSQQALPQLKQHYDGQWQAHFERLQAYRQQYGTCQVSLKIDPELQRWTRWQRLLFQEGKLQPRRRQQLDAIQFPWDIQQSYWMKMYGALADFKRLHGHTRVPNPKTNNKLAAWVCRQRKSKALLSARQLELLQALDFDWQVPVRVVVPWEEMYARLLAFQQAFGHTRVPVAWPQDPKLGKWVSRLRQQQPRLSPARIHLLNAIGFDWDKRRGRQPAP